MTNRFNSKQGDQSIGQGDGAIGSQTNTSSVDQDVTGNGNIIAGNGDVHAEVHHHHHAALSSSARSSSSGAAAQDGGTAAGAGGVAVRGDVHGNIYVNSNPTSKADPLNLHPSEDAVFLHREIELTWLDEHLHPDKVVAVCAPGGMGKSALATRAVRRLDAVRFPDGIVFHTFYHQPETAMAMQTIAHAFGLKAEADLEQQVRNTLAAKQALLILDGTEEAKDLRAVLALRGSCGVLITSRKKTDAGPLRLDLQPLPDDQAEEVLRAWGGDAGDQESIERISELLGGWPVALRLAGHYLHSTGEPASDYLRWLEQEPFKELGDGERHQAENAALLLQRSAAQVGKDSRLVLGLAGCLAFDLLATAPMMALLEGDERRCRTAVNELVNYGLLERRDDRLHIGHALIHQYAAKHLGLSKEALERVAHYYLGWCKTQSAAGLPGYALLDKELAHCLRLIAACLDRELWREVQEFADSMWNYLDQQGHWIEQFAACEMRLMAARKAENYKEQAVSLSNLGYTCWRRGEYEQALQWFEQCLPIWHEIDDPQGESATLTGIGSTYWAQGDHEQALYYNEQSLAISREIGDRKGEGTILNNLGTVYKSQDDDDQAFTCYQQCLLIWKELGNKKGQATALDNIAIIYHIQDNTTKSIEYRKQALAICREIGDRVGETVVCWNLGLIYDDLGDLAQAEEHISLAVEIAEAISYPKMEEWRNYLERLRAERGGRRGTACRAPIIFRRPAQGVTLCWLNITPLG